MQIQVSTFAFIRGNRLRCAAVSTLGPLMVKFFSATWPLTNITNIAVLRREGSGELVKVTFDTGGTAETVVSACTRATIETIAEKNCRNRDRETPDTDSLLSGIKQHNYLGLLAVTPLILLANALLSDHVAQSPVASGLMLLGNFVWAFGSTRYAFAVGKHFIAMKHARWRFYVTT